MGIASRVRRGLSTFQREVCKNKIIVLEMFRSNLGVFVHNKVATRIMAYFIDPRFSFS